MVVGLKQKNELEEIYNNDRLNYLKNMYYKKVILNQDI